MNDRDYVLAERFVSALERVADHFCGPPQKERKPAVLTTAKYSREERAHEEVRQTLRPKEPNTAG